MIINIAKLEAAGYEIAVKSGGPNGRAVTEIHINGTDAGTHEYVITALRDGFPNVGQDTLTGIAQRALIEAQGHDIVRICAQN